MARCRRASSPRTTFASLLALLLAIAALSARPANAQLPTAKLNFRAVNYDVTAALDTTGQAIYATAKVDFLALEASSSLVVELHPNLNVTEVTGPDGKPVEFQRMNGYPLGVAVTLPHPVAANARVTLTFTYAGILANEENSPVRGLRLASIYSDGAYLLLPARWFPLTGYPSNRYTATFHLDVPDNFAVAGTGTAGAPTPSQGKGQTIGNRLIYDFHCDQALPNGTFVAGNKLQLNPEHDQGIAINVYAPKYNSPLAPNPVDFAADAARAVITFSDLFGPLQNTTLSVIQIPDNTVREYSAPGVVLLSARHWDAKTNERTIARLVAGQWWGSGVLPATTSDVWISDGLARYSEAMYEEQRAGKEASLRVVDDYAVGSLMYEDAAPLAQAGQLVPFTGDYRSVVMNKGAMIFHMLRAVMGDVPFKALLHDFYAKYQGKTATIQDFETMAEAHLQPGKNGAPPPNLRSFFAQWMNSTGIPEFKLEYVVYRTPKDFRIVGKISQPLDTFAMPVQVRVDTEGNPETDTVEVTGTDSPFMIETFGRPKPGGIHIDYNNLILKANPSLRSRAAIARGEELAEQGRYYDAIQQYQKALAIQPNKTLANYRMGEAFFYQKNYQAAANAFREALQTVPEPAEKWTEVWSHIYLGRIFDVLGQRERAVNEYSKARQTNDNTSGAQAVAEGYLKKAYTEGPAAPGATNAQQAPTTPPPAQTAPSDDRPTLKRPNN